MTVGEQVGERAQGLRVLHVVDSLGAGGMENGIVNVANRMRGRIDSWVAALRRRGEFADRMPEPKRVVEMGKGGGFSPAVAWRLAKYVREVNPDVVHTHNLGPLIYSGAARLISTGRFPPIVHGEHSVLESEELGFRRVLQRRVLYRGCSAVHTVSQGLLSSMRENGLVASKMVAIINGVDSERFKPSSDHLAEEGTGKIVFGIVGRLVKRKRHAMLLRAFEALAAEYPMLKLLIVGDQGPERERVEHLVSENRFRDRIEWVPFQERPEEFYRHMDLLIVPSESEGLANVVLEGMACGVPVAGSDACGTPEVVKDGETGFLGRIEHDEDLVALLRRALDAGNERLQAMGRRSRDHISRRFSLDSMAEAYLGLYRSVVWKQ